MNPFINHCALQTATVVSSDTWSKNGNRVVKKVSKKFFFKFTNKNAINKFEIYEKNGN